jgi:hypothetical protein
MSRFLGLILGNSRITSAIGFVLAVPGVYDAITAFGAHQPVNVRGLIGSIALGLLGRFARQEKAVAQVAQ